MSEQPEDADVGEKSCGEYERAYGDSDDTEAGRWPWRGAIKGVAPLVASPLIISSPPSATCMIPFLISPPSPLTMVLGMFEFVITVVVA